MADADRNELDIHQGDAIWSRIKDVQNQIQRAEKELANTQAEIEAKQQQLQQKCHELEVGQHELEDLKRQFSDLLQNQRSEQWSDRSVADADGSHSSAAQADDDDDKDETSRWSNGRSNHHPHDSEGNSAPPSTDHVAPINEPDSAPHSASSESNGHTAHQSPSNQSPSHQPPSPAADGMDEATVMDVEDAMDAERAFPPKTSSSGSFYHLSRDNIPVRSERLDGEVPADADFNATSADQTNLKAAFREPQDKTPSQMTDDEVGSSSNFSLELEQAEIWALLERMIGSILAIAALLVGVLGIVKVLGGSTEALLLIASGVLIGIASGLLLSPSLPIPWRSFVAQMRAIRDRTSRSQPQDAQPPKHKRRSKY